MTMDGSGRCHGRTDQMSTSSVALTSFKVTVAGRGATLAWLQAIGIHGQTHRATWFTPLESGRTENLIQAFVLGLLFDQARARDDHGQLDVASDFLAQFFYL